MIKTVHDLEVYEISFELAMEIFRLTRKFPKEEKYSLSDQIVRSSRSVPVNIREGFAKRNYEKIFIRQLITAIGSSEETRCWLKFSSECGYITKKEFKYYDKKYDRINAMIYKLYTNWQNYS